MSEAPITRRSLHDRRPGRTDWDRLDQLTDGQIDEATASDGDAAPPATSEWMAGAEVIAPGKRAISIRLDRDVLEYFQATGKSYQTRINKVLRAYVEAQKKRA